MTAPESMSTVLEADAAPSLPRSRPALPASTRAAEGPGARLPTTSTPPRATGSPPARRLLVMLHGCSQTPRGVAVATQWNELAEEHNFIVAYPGQSLAVPSRRDHRARTASPATSLPTMPAGASSSTQLDPCWRGRQWG